MNAVALHQHHPRTWRTNRYVYPVISRRSRGLSIGINLNPDAVCNFNCVYCSVDLSTARPHAEVDLDLLQDELETMLDLWQSDELFHQPPFDATPASLRRLNDIAFSGDGEPTASPHFRAAVEGVCLALERRGLDRVKSILLTNATLLHRPEVMAALDRLHRRNSEIWTKLDAGTEAYFRTICRTSTPYQRVLDNILRTGRVQPVVIQSMFATVKQQAPGPDEIDAYIARLRDLLLGGCVIQRVQVYTVARPTREAWVNAAPDTVLGELTARAAGLGLTVETIYGRA